jgi:hypothetical protein
MARRNNPSKARRNIVGTSRRVKKVNTKLQRQNRHATHIEIAQKEYKDYYAEYYASMTNKPYSETKPTTRVVNHEKKQKLTAWQQFVSKGKVTA